MNTTYLKFTDEAQAKTLMADFITTEPVMEMQDTGETTTYYNYRYMAGGDVGFFPSKTELTQFEAEAAADRHAKFTLGYMGEVTDVAFEGESFEPIKAEVQVGTREVWISTTDATIDVVGIIHKPTGEMIQSEDGEYPEMAPIPGFHVNLRGDVPEALEPFVTHPATPSRVFL